MRRAARPARGLRAGADDRSRSIARTYVLAYRSDRGLDIKGFDDPALKGLKIGVFQTSSMRQVLTKRGLAPYLKLQDAEPQRRPQS